MRLFIAPVWLSALLTLIDRLAMCGIAQGPCELQRMSVDAVRADMTLHTVIYLYQSMALAPYFTYVESTAARELFDFQNPESIAAIKFLAACVPAPSSLGLPLL